MEFNGSKDSTNILQVGWTEIRKKHLHTENCKDFYYIIKVFVDYELSTVHFKKIKTLHLQRNTYNKY